MKLVPLFFLGIRSNVALLLYPHYSLYQLQRNETYVALWEEFEFQRAFEQVDNGKIISILALTIGQIGQKHILKHMVL